MDPAGLTTLPQLVSIPRFQKYLEYCGRDEKKAARLYSWNLEITGALWGSVSVLEVVLRNALHNQLTSHFGTDHWYVDPACKLAEEERRSVQSTLDSFARKGTPNPSADDFVGSANFGLWTGLTGGGIPRDKDLDYDQSLWVKNLENAFPYRTKKRRQIHSDLDHVRRLRNRMAHHEPIYHWKHEAAVQKIVTLAGFIHPDAADYIRNSNSVKDSVANFQSALETGDCCF